VRHWLALTPALSQVWEREQEAPLQFPAPLLPELGEGVGGEGKIYEGAIKEYLTD
jgi:hypothetical protein